MYGVYRQRLQLASLGAKEMLVRVGATVLHIPIILA